MSYDPLNERIKELVPDCNSDLHIEDVFRASAKMCASEAYPQHNEGLIINYHDTEKTSVRFDLTKPLSAPENEAACAAVLKLLV